MAYVVLGPKGTFSEEAAKYYWGQEAEIFTAASIPEAFTLVENGEVEGALVPLENSLSGSIKPTMEGLETHRVYIAGETELQVRQHLMGKEKYALEEIELLISQPVVLLQCEKFIKENLSEVRTEIASSTARTAQIVSRENKKAVCIGNENTAQLYGLQIVCHNIEEEDNITRFVHIVNYSVDHGSASNESDAFDKSSLVFTLQDRPGALYESLGVFARNKINMTKIESRPSSVSKNRYTFYVDLEPGLKNADHEVLEELRQYCQFIKYLGAYNSARNVRS